MPHRTVALATPSAAQIIEDAADHLVGHPDDGWCVVVPRNALAATAKEAVLARLPQAQRTWVGPRVMTIEALLEHYASADTVAKALTPIQMRQMIAAAILTVHAQDPDGPFGGNVQDGRVAEAVLSALHRLFLELEPQELTSEVLLQHLTPPEGDASHRAQAIVRVYEQYLEWCAAHEVRGPLGSKLAAVKHAAHAALPDGVRRLYFLGFDASGPNDLALRLFASLHKNPAVEQLVLALTYPSDRDAMRWSAHGNDMTMRWLSEIGVPALVVPDRVADLLPTAPPDLRAMVADPFAYRAGRAPATGAVQCVRVPDSQLEIDWLAADIKRRLLGEPALRPDDIAVVARDMDEREADLRRALDTVGIPVVASRKVRVLDLPAVRAVLTLLRVGAHDWRVADVVAAAESPYLDLGMSPTLLAELANQGTLPHGAAEWEQRAVVAAANLAPVSPELGLDTSGSAAHTALSQLVEGIRRTRALLDGLVVPANADEAARATAALAAGEPVTQSAAQWIKALNRLIDALDLEAKIHRGNDTVDRSTNAHLAQADLDAMTAFLRGAQDWLIGRQYAGMADGLMTARAWYHELEQVAGVVEIRLTSYPRKAVALVDAIQTGLRRWKTVYIIGLTDRAWPRQAQYDEHALTDFERAQLHLPTKAERAAKEGLYFQMATAAATERLVLLTPAADDRGKALVASPFINCLQLRLDGVEVTQATARTLLPQSEQDLLQPDDRDLFAAARYRAVATAAHADAAAGGSPAARQAARTAALRAAIAADPILGPWESSNDGRAVQRLWGIQRLRTSLDREGLGLRPELLDPVAQRFIGVVPEAPQMSRLQALTTTWSPADLQTVDGCRFRFFVSRVLGVRRGTDEDHDEAAAFGTLQHRILERLYRELQGAGHLPPNSDEDVKAGLRRLPDIARQEVSRYLANAREQLWAIDFVVLLDLLKGFVRRDLTEWRTRQLVPNIPRLRTRLLALEEAIGTVHPVTAVADDGTTFRLRTVLDRIEVVDDLRLGGRLGKLNGWLVLKEYKSNRKGWGTRPDEYLKGQHLQLPLKAYAAEQHVQQAYPELAKAKTFAIGEVKTSIDVPMMPLARREVSFGRTDGGHGLIFDPHPAAPDGDLLQASMRATIQHAGDLVKVARAGTFAPQPGRRCYGCAYADICRAAAGSDGGPQSRHRAAMPLAVTHAEYRRHGGDPAAEGGAE